MLNTLGLLLLLSVPTSAEVPRLICCGGEEVFLIPADLKDPSPEHQVWRWQASHSSEIPREAHAWFRTTDDCKPEGDCILISSSSGGVALIRRHDKRCLFYTSAKNAHSACLLPENRIAVASSFGGDELLIYEVSPLVRQAEPVARLPLVGAHGVIWDRERKRLFALGNTALILVNVPPRRSEEKLEVVQSWELPTEGGHDLSSTGNPEQLCVTTNSHVYLFDKQAGTFELHPGLGELKHVKSVDQHPVTGEIVYHQATDEHWWSDTIRFPGERQDLQLPQVRLYKIRWDHPNLPPIPEDVAEFLSPPEKYVGDLGEFRSPLVFSDGRQGKTPEDWPVRKQEILTEWHSLMGAWPPLQEEPTLEIRNTEQRENFTQHQVRVEVAAGMLSEGYLLIPNGDGPFPAVIVPYYDPQSGAGLGKELRDFGYQLARRGFVTLSIGGVSPRRNPDVSQEEQRIQPLSFLAYATANCLTALSQLESVDPSRIGIVGHSFGGKWAMFASCLDDRFACAAWSDGGIVFDESRGNINYWEPWYLGYDPQIQRKPGIPNENNPRTGAYKEMIERGRDLHELHALMAGRPFLVSGGSEDPPERWRALNHAIALNELLGFSPRVGMTNRSGHNPTPESNEQIYRFFESFLRDRSPKAEQSPR